MEESLWLLTDLAAELEAVSAKCWTEDSEMPCPLCFCSLNQETSLHQKKM